MLFIAAISEFFRHKVVGSVIVLVCWSALDEVKYAKEFSLHGMKVTFACEPSILENPFEYNFQGILYIQQEGHNILEKVTNDRFTHRYKWLLIGQNIPDRISEVRYDADIAILRENADAANNNTIIGVDNNTTSIALEPSMLHFDDVYIHPRDGVSTHEWAHWSQDYGFRVTRNWEKIQRRLDMKQYPFRIVAPVAHYTKEGYNMTFGEYLVDLTVPDAGLRSGYGAAALVIEALNASEILLPVRYWASDKDNSSILLTIGSGSADISAGVLRIMEDRDIYLDFIMPIWLFSVGFTYLAERESSSNMYVEPFTAAVWWTCLGTGLVLALAQRATSRKRFEKDGAFVAVLATCLQQDANAVPEGISGRWTFTVLSVCSMLVHAYYTSAIVSALMSTGRGGPTNLRELADSRYAIASEDHDFIKFILFSAETNWTDLEYLKKKKMTSKFYIDIEYGIRQMQLGTTAYHAEYHQIYHYLDILSDDEVCKLQQVDTIPESMTWISTTARGQWTNIYRSVGAWLYETGLARRLILRVQTHPPPCRMAMLAEQVTFWDVAPLLALTTMGAVASCGILGLEILLAKYMKRNEIADAQSTTSQTDLVPID